MSRKTGEKLGILIMGSLGVVFGDLGTSPLYAMRVCFMGSYGIAPSADNVLGIASLIFWSLALVVSIKYCMFILRVDDDGEGGIFAMMALLHGKMGAKLSSNLILVMCFGSALLYGDGLITPVISVLSALEGLDVATTSAKPFILPVTCLVLVLLFMLQSHGSGRIGKFFGPIICLWFVAIGTLGINAILARQRFWRLLIPSTRSGFLQSTVGAGTLFWERLCFVSLAVKPCTWTWVILGERPSVFPGISWHYRPCCAIILARPR